MVKTTDDKIVFGIAPDGTGDGIPLILLGVTAGAWEYMRDGKTHTFDLSAAGVPIKLILFAAADHAAAKAVIETLNQSLGKSTLDLRRTDFSIKP